MLRELNVVLEAILHLSTGPRADDLGQGKVFSAGVEVAEHLPDRAGEMLARSARRSRSLATSRYRRWQSCTVLHSAAAASSRRRAISSCARRAPGSASPRSSSRRSLPVAAVTFPRMCGPKRTFELLLLGEPIGARKRSTSGLPLAPLRTRRSRTNPPGSWSARVDELSGPARARRGRFARDLGVRSPMRCVLPTASASTCSSNVPTARRVCVPSSRNDNRMAGGGRSSDPHAVRGAP